jgi:hypothetical protein
MKHAQVDNIGNAIGWLCGAVFLLAPVVALVYAFRQRWRPAFQAGAICALSLPSLVGVRALMIAQGLQHRRSEWLGLNMLALLVIPLLATRLAAAIPWPHPKVWADKPR